MTPTNPSRKIPADVTEASENISVLVCLSGSPSNRKVIRTAARYARGNGKSLTALYVDNGRISRDDPALAGNIALAASLGAHVETVAQRDILGAVTEYARRMAVTDLFIGYSGPSRLGTSRHLAAYRLVKNLPEVDVHIIPSASSVLKPSELRSEPRPRLNSRDILTTAFIMAAATGISVLFDRSRFSNSNIITIYILAILITSVMTAERIYGIISAVLYILLFNFLFIDPRFSLLVYDPNYMVTYFVSVIAAVITSNISSKMKETTLQARINAYQAQILLNASEQLQRADGSREITSITVSQLSELLGREILFFPVSGGRFTDEEIPEREAAGWTLLHNQRAGWGTHHFPHSGYQFLSVRTGSAIYGIVGVHRTSKDLTSFEENILLSLISECALSLESENNRKGREEAQIIATNERFRSNLLRSISHDLRTPLTSISGNASNLLSHAGELSEADKNGIYSDIYEDSVWLTHLVENLLSITRLEESVGIHPVTEVVADVLENAVAAAQRHRSSHTIVLERDTECLMAVMDVSLILQVLSNLISNAVKYTPDGSTVRIRDWREGDQVIVSVSDNGPGISGDDKLHVFDLFYTGKHGGADSSRSLGLGLNLCQSILAAHHQKIWVADVLPHGADFRFTLQLAKGDSHESISDTHC